MTPLNEQQFTFLIRLSPPQYERIKWPRFISILEQTKNEMNMMLGFTRNGNFVCVVARNEDYICEVFQPTRFKGLGNYIVVPSLGDGVISLVINGEVMSTAECEPNKVFVIECEDTPLSLYVPKYQNLHLEGLELPERNFLGNIYLLESALIKAKEPDILSATSTLRLLLIENPYSSVINRKYGGKWTFQIAPFEPPKVMDGLGFRLANIYNETSAQTLKTSHSLKQFLSYPIGHSLQTEISVRDLILLAANYLGNSHFGISKNKHDKKLDAMFMDYDCFKIFQTPAVLNSMDSICKCALDGFEPIVKLILNAKA